MPDCILTPPNDESVITYTQLSGVHGVNTQSHVLPIIQAPVSQEPDVGRTLEPILAEVSTQEPIVQRLALKNPLWQRLALRHPLWKRLELRNSKDESAPIDGQFFYDNKGIDTTYETEYDVQSSKDTGTDDDDVDEDFLVDEENEIVKPNVDVHLFGISMDIPFDNIGVTNLVLDDVLKREDVDIINMDGFDSDPGNDEEKIIGRGEAKDRVYLYSIESRSNLKLYKNDGVRIRARCDGKVLVFTMSQGIGPTSLNCRMEARPSGSSGPTTRTKKGRIQVPVMTVKHLILF
ncbi:hypothetical protein Tco_1178674 [Tanacetum coccineum]